MSRRTALIYIFIGLVVLTVYMVVNKDWFIREHMANSTDSETKEPTPTVYTLSKRLDETEEKLNDLSDQFNKTNNMMQVQSQRAAAAQATLQAIPTV